MSDIPPPPPIELFNSANFNNNKENKEQKEITNEKTKYIGLKNQGATCYLNSLIQTLFMTPEFRYELLKWNYNPAVDGEAKDCIPLQLQKLFFHLQEPIRKIEETKMLTKSFQWSSGDVYVQQDIQELCRVLFEAIEISLSLGETQNEKNNFIKNLYQGKTCSVIKCLECKNKSINNDFYMDLSLPIMNIFEGIHNKSLDMAFMNSIKPEKLEGPNQYFCEKCQKKVDAEKYSQFVSFPKILFLQLGRFFYDFETDRRKKINDRIPFPLILNCNKYLKEYSEITYNEKESENDDYCLDDSEEKIKKFFEDGEYVYELFSIVIQSGTADGGHYYAYIKSFEDNKWYRFNDSCVSLITKDEISKVFGDASSDSSTYKNYCSSTTGYYLSYRKMINPNNNNEKNEKLLTINDMVISENLRELCKDEDLITIQQEKENEEKTQYKKSGISDPQQIISFYVYTDKENQKDNGENKYDIQTISLKSKEKCELLLKEIYKKYNYDEEKQKLLKIREFEPNQLLIKKYIEINNNELIGVEFKKSNCIYLQFPIDKEGNYPVYDENKIEINLYNYPSNGIDDNFDIQSIPKIKTSISLVDSLDTLTKKICEIFGYKYEDKNLYVFKKFTMSGLEENISEIDHDDLYSQKQILIEFIPNNSELFVGTFDSTKDGEKLLKWNKYLDKLKPKITISFNNINPEIGSEKLIIIMSGEEKMENVKEEIIKTLNNPTEFNMENLVLKNKKNGKEIIDLSDTLKNYSNFGECSLYIEKGTPLTLSQKILTLFYCEFNYKEFNFYPYQFTQINERIIIDGNLTIEKLKTLIIDQHLNELPEILRNFQDAKESKILIRAMKANNPTKIYLDFQIINEIFEEDFSSDENKLKLCIQIVPNELIIDNFCDIKKFKYEIAMRYIDLSNWNLTPPTEILLNDNTTNEKLCEIILKKYPQIEKTENIQIIKFLGTYKTYLDTLLNFKPNNLMNYSDNLITKLPLFINKDGIMLIIMDKRIKASEPNEEIKKYGFTPVIKNNETSINDNKDKKSEPGRVQKMLALFNSGDFDPASRTFNSSNTVISHPTQRPKEKGLVIKIKKIEDETKGEENKDKQTEEQKNEDKDEKLQINTDKKEDKKEEVVYNFNDEVNDMEPII